MRAALASLVGASLCAAPLLAGSGVLITFKTAGPNGMQTNQVQVEPDRLRADTTTAAGQKQTVVFDADKQLLTAIDYEHKAYRQMTKADADRLGSQMSSAIAQLQAQMASMPPEQRAQLEAMMRGGVARLTLQAPAIDYRQAGTDKVAQWSCEKYEGFISEQKVSELCTVQPQALGFTAADFAITAQFESFFQQMIPQNMGRLFALGDPARTGFSGFPIRQITFANGEPRTTSELTAILAHELSGREL